MAPFFLHIFLLDKIGCGNIPTLGAETLVSSELSNIFFLHIWLRKLYFPMNYNQFFLPHLGAETLFSSEIHWCHMDGLSGVPLGTETLVSSPFLGYENCTFQ
jgi:hypothetical protein